MSARTRRSLTLLWIALFLCSIGMQYVQMAAPSSVLASPTGSAFQLEGNAVDDGTGDDWENIDDGSAHAQATTGILTDSAGRRFTQGSKDTLDMSSNAWDVATVPDKDDILHAYAALYDIGGNDTVAFGLDRYANNGDAHAGFWFFQDQIGINGNGTFSGHRTPGDVFIVSDFTSGGQLSTIKYYTWTANGLSSPHTGVECAAGSQDLCAISNQGNTPAPWSYTPKQGSAGTFPVASFFEGAINLDAIFDKGAPCFSSFLAETRSSTSETAELKNFLLGEFATCEAPKIATQVQQDGADITSINKGESVVDVATFSGTDGEVTGKVDFFVCGPDTGGKPDCSNGGDKVGDTKTIDDETATSDPFTPTKLGWYCFRAEYTPSANAHYLAGEHTNTTTECFRVKPADVQIVKTPNDGSANAGDSISFSLSWTNEGEGKATGVVVTDDLPGGDGLDWAITGSTGTGSTCAISGAVGSEKITCTIGTIAGNPNFPDPAPVNGTVTVSSATTAADCGAIDNSGTNTSDNDGTDVDPGKITVLCPDIKVTKTPDGAKVDAGDPITWNIKVENIGAGVATGVTLSDSLPSGIDWSESEADCAITGAVGSEVLGCTVGTLAPGASKTYQVTGTTDKTDCGVVNNTGIASATNEPSDKLANNSDSGSVEVLCADIRIEKTADDTTVSAGDPIGFDVVVTNAGNGTAKAVSVSDTLPVKAGLSWTIESVTGDGSPSCGIAAGVLTCTSASLGAGKSFTVHIVSPTTSASCGVIDNTASVVAGNDGSDSDDASVTVQCPDVTVVKTADKTPINAGDTAAFTITVSNAGPGVAKDVTLNDPLPAGVAWSEDSASCSITNNVLSCSFGDLAAGASKVVHVTGVTDAADCGTLPNTATVAASNEATAQGGNNSSNASIVVRCPDISVVKSGNGPISAGQTATFTIVLSNAGPGDAYDVTLTDQLPAGDWALGGADAASCDIDGSNELTCDFGTVLAGASRTITVSKTSEASDCDAIPNSVTVGASNEPAGATGNNDDDATIVVNCPDLTVQKSGNGPISAGENAVFTITVTNLGPGIAFDATLDDDLPAGIEWGLGGADAADCSIDTAADPDALHCDFGQLNVGASRTVTLTGETTAADCGSIPNLASVAASNEAESDLGNNKDDATIVVDCPLIVITKTADDLTVNAGDQIGFTIEVTNTGAGTAFGVTVSDTLPAGMSWSESPDVAGWSISAGVLSFGPASLAGGASTSVHIVATTDAADCGIVPNTAFMTYQGGAGDDDAQVTVNCPDITVVKSGVGPIVNGQTATFTITTTNLGPGVAYDVTLEDQLPAGAWTLGGADAADCSIDGSNKLTCDFGDIDAPGGEGDSRTITVSKTTTTDDCGTILNEVTVGASNEPSTKLDNNGDDASIDVRCPDVDLDKTVDDSSVEPNQTVTYTIDVQVTNGPVTNAVVTDDLPVGQTYTVGSASPSEPTVSQDGRTLTWTFPTLANGDPAVTITYDVTIDADASADPQQNTAEVCVDEDTPCASDVALVTPQFPDIQIVKTAGDAADGAVYSTPAGPVTYTYVVTNTGPLALHDVTVTDDAGTPNDTSDDFAADCPKTALAPAESMTCTSTVTIAVDTTNVALAHGLTEQGNPVDDDDDAKVVVLEFGLVIDKTNDAPLETLELPDGSTAELPTADEGETVTFTLDYTLIGDPVTDGIITDVLPAGLTYVSGSATNDAQFTFQSYDDATRTLTWTASDVSTNGTVTYQVTVDVGASELAQPLENVATIDSAETEPDSDVSDVYVPTIPAAATGKPRVTLPPTDTIGGAQESSNPGFSLMLILLALAATVIVVGFVTPVPASVRERDRR
jgi:uncharacterized repeat protein (TIGR01451 family)